MRWLVGLLLGMLLAQVAGTAQTHVERIEFCEVVRNASNFDGKEISVRATYNYWFETSELFCFTCRDNGRVWLDFSEDLDDASRNVLHSIPKDAGTVNISLTGTFVTGGSYGDGGYRHRFVARKAWNAVVLVRGSKPWDKVKKKLGECACGGTNPR